MHHPRTRPRAWPSTWAPTSPGVDHADRDLQDQLSGRREVRRAAGSSSSSASCSSSRFLTFLLVRVLPGDPVLSVTGCPQSARRRPECAEQDRRGPGGPPTSTSRSPSAYVAVARRPAAARHRPRLLATCATPRCPSSLGTGHPPHGAADALHRRPVAGARHPPRGAGRLPGRAGGSTVISTLASASSPSPTSSSPCC